MFGDDAPRGPPAREPPLPGARSSQRTVPPSSGVMRVFRALAGEEPQGEVVTETIQARQDFTPAPIRQAWILEGEPVARSLQLAEAPDGNLGCCLWECTRGTIRWQFFHDEVVHILEGEVRIRDEAGLTRTLRPGDVAYFPKGAVVVWEIETYVKKLAVVRSPESIARRVLRAVGL